MRVVHSLKEGYALLGARSPNVFANILRRDAGEGTRARHISRLDLVFDLTLLWWTSTRASGRALPFQTQAGVPAAFRPPGSDRMTSLGICVRVSQKGVSNVELAASLLAQISRVDSARPWSSGASRSDFQTVPTFKSPRSSLSVESLGSR